MSDSSSGRWAARTPARSHWLPRSRPSYLLTSSSWPSKRSGGSPEFLLDLLAAAAAGERDELPDNVGAATMARIDALDPRDGAIVRRAAVLGLRFAPHQLADVLDAE